MPYISTIERLSEARGEARGKVDLLSLLLTQQIGAILRKLSRNSENCQRNTWISSL